MATSSSKNGRVIAVLIFANEARRTKLRARQTPCAARAPIVMATGDRVQMAERIDPALDLDAVLAERAPFDMHDAVVA